MMPVEKLRLRPWLENALNSGRIPGIKWVDAREKIFQVSWKHASRHGWHVDTDACIFKEWAIHTGRYREVMDKPDPRRWKANFRCALNALPDIKELQARGVTRGNNAYKVYQMLRKNTDVKEKERIKNERVERNTLNDIYIKEASFVDGKNSDLSTSRCTDSRTRESVYRFSYKGFMRIFCLEHPAFCNPHNSGQDVTSKVSSKVINKCSKTATRTTPQVFKRHSVIHKSSSVIHGDSSLPICTSHPISPQSFYTYWPTSPLYQYPHMKDHDYLTTWYDPRPEMKDIGVMTYQEIKKEPGSPDSQSKYCNEQYDQDSETSLNESHHYSNEVKQEKAIPSDQEIVDLVDSLSRDSDSLSHRSESSSFDEYEEQEQYSQSSSRASPKRLSSLELPPKQDLSSEYAMSYEYQNTPPPPLTPESTSEILKGITSPVAQ